MIIINTYKCELKLTNTSEWLHYASDILKDIQDTEELLERVCNFNFKFDTILQ